MALLTIKYCRTTHLYSSLHVLVLCKLWLASDTYNNIILLIIVYVIIFDYLIVSKKPNIVDSRSKLIIDHDSLDLYNASPFIEGSCTSFSVDLYLLHS